MYSCLYYCFISCLYYCFIVCSFFPCSFVARPLLAPYVFNGRFSRRSRRLRRRMQQSCIFRRQKTVSANESAKADAADNAEKDSYHIVECCSCLHNKSVREHACSFLVLSLLVPYVFNGRSHGNILQTNTEPSLLELC